MSHLIETQSYSDNLSRNSSCRTSFNFHTLSQYLSSFTSVQESLKYFNASGQKFDIILDISIYKPIVSVLHKIHIDRRRLSYVSKFIIKFNSEVLCCYTKCLRLMVIKQLETLKKKMKVYSYAITVDHNTGEIGGKHIFCIGHNTNINELLQSQFTPIKNHLNRFLTIVLSLMNVLPPLFTDMINERVKGISQVSIEQKIQKRIYNYGKAIVRPLLKCWRSLKTNFYRKNCRPKSQLGSINNHQRCMHIVQIHGFPLLTHKYEITPEESGNIQIHLKTPTGMAKKSQSNFTFNQIKVLQESAQAADTGLRGASTKILVLKMKFIYMNALTSSLEAHSHREIDTKQYTKVIAIKAPVDNINIDRAKKKGDHQISILKIFSETQTPFLLRYFVSTNQNFKYNNLLMMNFVKNCETLTTILSKKKQILSFSSKIYVLINILQALRLIKQYRVVHMDLSPSNILVSANYITQLIDFGQSYHQKVCGPDYSPGYTLPFSFPQKFTSKHFTGKSDIFSFGVLTFYFIFRLIPYNPSLQLVEALKNGTYLKKFYFAPESVEYYGYRKMMIFLFSFIQRCIDPDIFTRPHPGWSIILFKELYFWLDELTLVI